MSQVQLRVRVYSDCEVRNPEAYFDSVFHNHSQYWRMIQSEDPNCILCESVGLYDEDEIVSIYDSITPEMFESTERFFVRVSK